MRSVILAIALVFALSATADLDFASPATPTISDECRGEMATQDPWTGTWTLVCNVADSDCNPKCKVRSYTGVGGAAVSYCSCRSDMDEGECCHLILSDGVPAKTGNCVAKDSPCPSAGACDIFIVEANPDTFPPLFGFSDASCPHF